MKIEDTLRAAHAVTERRNWPGSEQSPPNTAYTLWQAVGSPGVFVTWTPPVVIQTYLDMAFPPGDTLHESIPLPPGAPKGEPYPYGGFGTSRSGASTRGRKLAGQSASKAGL